MRAVTGVSAAIRVCRLLDLVPDMPKLYTTTHVRLPLAGQDLFVSDDTFAAYGAAAFELIHEIAQCFEAKADDLFCG
jgi:hypothetical protein